MSSHRADAGKRDVQAVARHYDAFPYPTVRAVSEPRPAGITSRTLSYLLRRRAAERLPDAGRVWVAGCGTQQAARWALCFPQAEVVASDVSPVTLAAAQAVASALGITNLRFVEHDLLSPPVGHDFFLVVCTGVLHHLPDPTRGLANLRAAMSDGGAALLMVYSSMLRGPLAPLRQTAAALARPGDDHQCRYQLALALLREVLDSQRCRPPCPEALGQLWARSEQDHSFVADVLCHPLEQTYDVDELLSLLQGAGLRHTSWLYPQQWRIDNYLRSAELIERCRALPPEEQWRAVYRLAGHAGPLLEVLAEPCEAPVRPAYDTEALLAMPLRLSTGERVRLLDGPRVTAERELAPFEQQGEALVGRVRSGYGVAERFKLPAYARPILEACDGTRTMGEIADAHAEDFGRDGVVELLTKTLPDDLGLVVPW